MEVFVERLSPHQVFEFGDEIPVQPRASLWSMSVLSRAAQCLQASVLILDPWRHREMACVKNSTGYIICGYQGVSQPASDPLCNESAAGSVEDPFTR